VVAAADLPETAPGETFTGALDTVDLKRLRDAVLASEKVLYKGHPVAGVAAVSPHIAEEALALIEVDYEVLPPVLTAPEGMAEGAPLLHESLRTTELGEQGDTASNIAEHFRHSKGDVEKGFAEADVIVEREFNTSTVHSGVHRAPQLHGPVEQGWAGQHLEQHPGPVRRQGPDGGDTGTAGLTGHADATGDRWRLRR